MKKIIIIDNKTSISLKSIFEKENIEVSVLTDPLNNEQIFINFNYDVILCRIYLKKLDGFFIVKWLKESLLLSIPIILFDEECTYRDFRRGIECGADDVISFPIDKTKLLLSLKTRIDKISILKENKIEK